MYEIKKDNTVVSVYLTPELLARIEAIKNTARVSKSSLLLAALRYYLPLLEQEIDAARQANTHLYILRESGCVFIVNSQKSEDERQVGFCTEHKDNK
jgi:hypothetical protein